MNLTINNQHIEVSNDSLSIKELLEIRNIPSGGTAVAVNNKLIKHADWELHILQDGDNITLISAAFGG